MFVIVISNTVQKDNSWDCKSSLASLASFREGCVHPSLKSNRNLSRVHSWEKNYLMKCSCLSTSSAQTVLPCKHKKQLLMWNLFLFETMKCLWEILPVGSETCTCINAQSIVLIYIIVISRGKKVWKTNLFLQRGWN